MISVSILIPHKNTKEKLLRALRTIPRNIEIIVVDDNSDVSIYKSLNEEISANFSNVTLYRNTAGDFNAGVARNIALDKSSTKWVLFADADDYFNTTALNELLTKLESFCSDVIYYGCAAVKEEDGSDSSRTDYYKNLLDKFPENKDRINYLWVVPWGKVIKRDFLIKNEIRYASRLACNDIEFSAKLALSEPKTNVYSKITYICTESNNSLTATLTSEKALARLQANIDRNSLLIKNKTPIRYSTNLRFFVYSIPEIIRRRDYYILPVYLNSLLTSVVINLVNSIKGEVWK